MGRTVRFIISMCGSCGSNPYLGYLEKGTRKAGGKKRSTCGLKTLSILIQAHPVWLQFLKFKSQIEFLQTESQFWMATQALHPNILLTLPGEGQVPPTWGDTRSTEGLLLGAGDWSFGYVGILTANVGQNHWVYLAATATIHLGGLSRQEFFSMGAQHVGPTIT